MNDYLSLACELSGKKIACELSGPNLRLATRLALREEANKVDQRLTSDLTKPQVNFVTSYANAGLGGSLNSIDNPLTASNVLLYQRLNQLSAAAGLAPVPTSGFGSLPGSLIGGYGSTLSGLLAAGISLSRSGISWI